MPTNPHSSPIFAGQFRHGIDAKNRVTIPADWRSGEAEKFYVHIDSSSSCIQVMPPDEYRRTVELVANAASEEDRQSEIRRFSAESQSCSADKQGRMVLPLDFCTKIGLSDEVMMVAAFGRFEIWNPVRWEDILAGQKASTPNVRKLGL